MKGNQAYSSQPQLADEDRTAETLSTVSGARWPARADGVSDAEIAQLVSVALNDALWALGRGNPEGALRSHAGDARSQLRETFTSLPWVQRTDPTVVTEYRKAVVFQDLTRDLALKMVDAIQCYAAVSEREVPNHVM